MTHSILIIDDEPQIVDSLTMILEYEGYNVTGTSSSTEGLNLLLSNPYDVALIDIQMPEMTGFELLTKVQTKLLPTAIIVISAFSNLENAIKATKLGAFDFIEKPIDRDKMLIAVRNGVESVSLKKENAEIKKDLFGETTILGKSRSIELIRDIIEKVAQTDVRVLITGENGTGKELVARAIFEQSSRKKGPFVEINCASIPNELIESELFGHEKGSFTGAMQQRIGKFEQANKGTLFLDEIGDMSLQAQAKVLRAIEDGKIERVGGNRKIDVDVRIVSATNKNLLEEIKNGNFREDLYHRLNVIPVHLAPLRERIDDLPILIEAFAGRISARYNRTAPVFTTEAIKQLQTLKWSGNIRELRNVIERIIILVNKPIIEIKDIEFLAPIEKSSLETLIDTSNSFQDFKEKAEKAFIIKQLEENDWNISKTAEILEIQRSHLYNKMKKYDIIKGDSL